MKTQNNLKKEIRNTNEIFVKTEKSWPTTSDQSETTILFLTNKNSVALLYTNHKALYPCKK